MEQRTCICSHGTYSWTDRSSGIIWVGVHGMDSICVVTMIGDLDTKRLRGWLESYYSYEKTLRCFRKSIISEIEDLADPYTSTLHQMYGQRIEKPFGVVSAIPLIPDTNEVHNHKESAHEPSSDDRFIKMAMLLLDGYVKEASANAPACDEKKATSAKPDEKKAIEFLQEKTKSGLAFTVKETIQTAISALQHLFQKKFKANEIEVSVLDPNYVVYGWEAEYKDILVKELETCEIEHHLAVVNELGSEGSGSGSSGRSTITFESSMVRSGFI